MVLVLPNCVNRCACVRLHLSTRAPFKRHITNPAFCQPKEETRDWLLVLVTLSLSVCVHAFVCLSVCWSINADCGFADRLANKRGGKSRLGHPYHW